MDKRVLRAMAKWPNVPAVYGWVTLDRRGRWRLDGGLVRNRTTIEAINRNYGCDQQGRSFYQNGPQRAYVNLEYTPWIYVLDGGGSLHTHTNVPLARLKGVWLDDESNLLLDSDHGIGAVSDVDLDALIERFCDASGQSLEDEVVEDVLEASPGGLDTGIFLRWEGKSLPIERIERGMVAERFGFVAQPLDVGNKTSTSD